MVIAYRSATQKGHIVVILQTNPLGDSAQGITEVKRVGRGLHAEKIRRDGRIARADPFTPVPPRRPPVTTLLWCRRYRLSNRLYAGAWRGFGRTGPCYAVLDGPPDGV